MRPTSAPIACLGESVRTLVQTRTPLFTLRVYRNTRPIRSVTLTPLIGQILIAVVALSHSSFSFRRLASEN